jgi:cell wall-associated NlpC family hydrolase
VVPAVIVATSLLGALPAHADDTPPYPTWHDVEKARDDARAAAAEVRRIAAVVIDLQHVADAATRKAQIADERYLRARTAARAARRAAEFATWQSEAAAAQADASRARAGAVASSLARTDLGTLPLGLMLNTGGAGELLHSLSTVSAMSVDAQQVYRQAAVDEQVAKDAATAAAAASARSTARSKEAKLAYAAARHQSRAAVKAVAEQQAHEQDLVAQLALLRRTSAQAACDYVAGLSHRPKCGTPTNITTVEGGPVGRASTPAAKAVAFARAQIGEPYVFGAAGPSAWDCSGLTLGAYASVGIGIGPHSATAQYNLARATGKLVSFDRVRPGDLLFYTDGGGDMYHTTIYSGNGLMIEAPYEGADVREVPVRTTQLVDLVARPAA